MATSSFPRTDRSALAALGVAIVSFGTLYARLAIAKSKALMPEWGFDVTFFHNLLWNISQGNGYRQSASYHEPPGMFNDTHFEPIFVLAAPIYKFAPSLDTFYVVQSGLLALGAVGIYRIARSAGARPWGAATGGLIYLLWWPLWRMAMADIRPLLWSIPFLLLLVAALREGRRFETFLWAGLACLCREEVPILVCAVLAASWAWRGARAAARRRITIRVGVATFVFILATYFLRSNPSFYIRPLYWLQTVFGAVDVDAALADYGHGSGDLLSTRVRYLAEWIIPAGLGALLAPELLLASSPLFIYLFTRQDEWASWEGPYIHWCSPALALVAAGAALGWTRALSWPKLPRSAAPAILAVVLLCECAVLFGHPGLVGPGDSPNVGWDRSSARWDRYIEAEVAPWETQESYVTEAHRLAGKVPVDASVMVDDGRGDRGEIQASLIHLLSGRSHVYSYQQEELAQVDPATDPLNEALLPAAAVDPTWALIHEKDTAWIARARAAGLLERDRGGLWVLLGPAAPQD